LSENIDGAKPGSGAAQVFSQSPFKNSKISKSLYKLLTIKQAQKRRLAFFMLD
jgi:hypothetical protein